MVAQHVAYLLAILFFAAAMREAVALVAVRQLSRNANTTGTPAATRLAEDDARRPLLFIGIYTAPTGDARFRRREIRETFWQHPLLRPGGPVEAKFVAGWTNETDEHALALTDEFEEHSNDFLRLDVKEAYNNLTMKTISLLRWFASERRAHFLLKMDDDTFPHIGTIVEYLRNVSKDAQPSLLHLGMLFPCAPVLKFTKWAENPDVWNHSFFPKYMQGSGYFLSAPLVDELAGVQHYRRNAAVLLNNEDASVGVWIEHSRWENPNLEIVQRSIQSTLTGCQPGDLLSMNNQRGYMSCYWRRHLRGEKDICCYGPLDHLRQSLLQVRSRLRAKARAKAAAASRMRLATRCYGDI
jgi:hypothetical protein